MRAAVRADRARLTERARIATIGFHLAAAGRVHRGKVRVSDDHLVAQRFEAPRHPLALGRGLEQDARPRPAAQMLRERRAGRADPLLDKRALPRANAELAGLPSCGIDRPRSLSVGLRATTTSGCPAASSHLPTRVEDICQTMRRKLLHAARLGMWQPPLLDCGSLRTMEVRQDVIESDGANFAAAAVIVCAKEA
jgi:hypothetical protein